eukprot:5293656-Pyramimonas_sp.AAC.1
MNVSQGGGPQGVRRGSAGGSAGGPQGIQGVRTLSFRLALIWAVEQVYTGIHGIHSEVHTPPIRTHSQTS